MKRNKSLFCISLRPWAIARNRQLIDAPGIKTIWFRLESHLSVKSQQLQQQNTPQLPLFAVLE
jgi:hypothetical protein